LKSRSMSSAFRDFVWAMSHAKNIIYLFFSSVTILAAMAFVLYEGKFTTQVRYTDRQFYDFLHSWVTMYVYISTHSNLADLLYSTIALPNGEGEVIYSLFLVCCFVVGAFFIFSLMLDMFCSKFLAGYGDALTPLSRNRWAGLTMSLLLWRRSLAHAEPESSSKPLQLGYLQQGFASERQFERRTFVNFVLQSYRCARLNPGRRLPWLVDLQARLQVLCSELFFDAHRENSLAVYKDGGVRPGISKGAWNTFISRIGRLPRGITIYSAPHGMPPSTPGEPEPWHAAELFALATISAELHNQLQYSKVLDLIAECKARPDLNSLSALLSSPHQQQREETLRAVLLPDTQSDRLSADKLFLSAPRDKAEMQERLMQACAWYGLPPHVGDSRTGELRKLVQLTTLHKWCLAAIADFVQDRSKNVTQGLEAIGKRDAYKMATLAELTCQLYECKWWQHDIRLYQVLMDIDDANEALLLGSTSLECERLHRTATGTAEIEGLLADLEAEQRILEDSLHLVKQEEEREHWTSWCSSESCFLLLYLVDLTNVFAVCLYVSGISIDVLDGWLSVYPCIHLLALLPRWRNGMLFWLFAYEDPIYFSNRVATLSIVIISFVGLALLYNESDGVADNVSRTLLSTTCLLTLFHGSYFRVALTVLSRALTFAGPFFATVSILALGFGKLCHDLYEDVDEQYFTDLKGIVLTTFRLFTTSGWHNIMWYFIEQTNMATAILFSAYMFIVSLLFGQLILGIIISISQQVLSFKSIRMHKLVPPYLQGLQRHERRALLNDFKLISAQLAHIHEEIYQLRHGRAPIDRTLESSSSNWGLPAETVRVASDDFGMNGVEMSRVMDIRDMRSCM